MKTIELPNYKLELYDSIHDIPAVRENRFQKFLLIDSGIGRTMQDIDNHFSTHLSQEKDSEESIQTFQNLRLSLWSNLSEYNTKHIAWVCLIKSINGDDIGELSEAEAKELIAKLSAEGLTSGMIAETLDEVKKNFPQNLPGISPDGEVETPENLVIW